MKNILFIGHETGLNGASKSLLNVISCIQNEYNVHVFLKGKGTLYDKLKKLNCNIIVLPYKIECMKKGQNDFLSFIKWNAKKLNYKFNIKKKNNETLTKMIEYVKENNIDLIHSNSSSIFLGAYLSNKTGTPHIWHFREFLSEDFNFEPVIGWDKFYTLASENSEYIITVSKSVMKKYQNKIKTKMRVIYNGVPFNDTSVTKEQHDSYNLLQAGIISPVKGVDKSIEALEKLYNKGYTDINLYLAGKGDLSFCNIEKMNCKNNIHLLGYVDNLYELRCRKIDAELVCSKAEAFGRVTVEAMQAGNPVIGANTAGTSEIIQDYENGILFNQTSSDSLADKILEIYTSKELAEKLTKNAMYTVREKYTIDRCVSEIKEVYDSVLS